MLVPRRLAATRIHHKGVASPSTFAMETDALFTLSCAYSVAR